MSNNVLKILFDLNKVDSDIPLTLIGVGGVFGKDDYEAKRENGASLVQIYTGLIYEGPSIMKKILN